MREFKMLAVCAVMAGVALNASAGQKTGTTRGEAAARTEYYYGQVVYSSADGKIEYGKTFSLVKRLIDPVAERILETVLQPSEKPGGKPDEYVTELKRAGPTAVFNASDPGKTFTGTLAFSGGAAWAWTVWLYDLKFTAGGSLKGRGELSQGAVKTEKIFTKPDGGATRITEDLKAISLRQYNAQYKKMLAGVEAK
jgi:hypothetical protein